MSRYLLDTTALIDFSKGRQPAVSRVTEMVELGDELGICAIIIAEFYSGIPREKYPIWESFFASLQCWEITQQVAQLAGQYRHDFARKGKVLSTTDALIAAVALERSATIVTNNLKDYPMDDVQCLAL